MPLPREGYCWMSIGHLVVLRLENEIGIEKVDAIGMVKGRIPFSLELLVEPAVSKQE